MKSILLIVHGMDGSGKENLRDKLLNYYKHNFITVDLEDIKNNAIGSLNENTQQWVLQIAYHILNSTQENNILYFDVKSFYWEDLKEFINKSAPDTKQIYLFLEDSLDPKLCINRANEEIENSLNKDIITPEEMILQYNSFIDSLEKAKLENNYYIYNDFDKLISYIKENI